MSTPRYRISEAQLRETFSELRRCGNGRRECQVLWVSPGGDPEAITEVIHPAHVSTAVSFDLEDRWLVTFFMRLAKERVGVRMQVHTHPGRAFHSATDDRWPIVQTPGFLSLVIPGFAKGSVGFEGAYLAELDGSGKWRSRLISDHIEVAR